MVDADLSGYFDSIPHPELMLCVARRVSDKALLHLIKQWLVAPVEETDVRRGQNDLLNRVAVGTPVARDLSTDPYLKHYLIRLLPWVSDGQSLHRDKDVGFGLWEPPLAQTPHPCPGPLAFLTAPSEDVQPGACTCVRSASRLALLPGTAW